MDELNSQADLSPFTIGPEIERGDDLLNFFMLSPVMMGMTDVVENDIRYVMANKATSDFLGFEVESFRGRLASELGISQEIIERWLRHFQMAKDMGRPEKFEYIHQDNYRTSYLLATFTYMGPSPLLGDRFSYVTEDISEIKKKKMALQNEINLSTLRLESGLAQLEAILQSVNDGIAVFNMRGELVLINDAGAKISGLKKDSFLHLEELKARFKAYDLSGKKVDSDEWPVARVLRGESFHDLELYTLREGWDNKKLISYSGRPVFDKYGKQILCVVILHDVTEVKRIEDEFVRSSNLLNTIMSSSDDVIYVKDLESRMIYSNPAALKLIGRPKSEVIGKNDREFLGKELGDQILKNDKFVMDSGQTHIFEERVGDKIFMSSKSPYRDNLGNVIGLLGISRDITTKKKEEAKLRALTEELKKEKDNLAATNEKLIMSRKKFATVVQSAPFAVALLNIEKKTLIDVNPAWVKMFGLKREEAINKTGTELGIHFADNFRDETYRKFEKEGIIRGLESTFYNRDKTPIRISCNLDIIEIGGEKVILASMEDITEKWKATIELEEALLARDEFLSIASHELKTPLSSLTLQTQLFLRRVNKGESDAFRKENVLRIVESTEKQLKRLSRLVDDMLDISRIRTGRLSISREEFNLCDLVQNVIEQLRPQIKLAETEIRLNTCEGVHGHWDLFRIEQVVNNLITNAIRYGKKRPITIDLSQQGNKVLLSIKDEGLGILPSDKERIFRRFERAVSKNEAPGLGLGLYITEQIVRAHNGHIWVESELGKGSTFFVELPLD